MSGNKNWAGNYTYEAKNVLRPSTVTEVQEIVAKSTKLKALGTRHSFNNIADTTEDQISTQNLGQIIGLDENARTVTIEGGVRYGELCSYLDDRGWALHNLASLPHISVAGACATGTHGSGNGSGCLSTAVKALKIVSGTGELKTLSAEQNPGLFEGAVVGVGALGVIVELSLEIEPTYNVEQQVFDRLPFASVFEHFEEIEASGYSVSLFTDWQAEEFTQVWVKRRVTDSENPLLPSPFYGAIAANVDRHPIREISAENCTDQLGVPGPWYDRLPHFKLGFTPSSGEELQSEYLVPREHAIEAIKIISGLSDRIAPLLLVCETRTVAADKLWLSPAYERDSVAFHFTWKQEWPSVRELLPVIESELAHLTPRPHWGKLFAMEHDRIKGLYPRLAEFQELAKQFDPEGKFRNPFLDKTIFASSES